MKLSYPIKAHNDSANYSSMNFYFINRNEVLNLTKVQKLWEKSCKYIHNSSIDDLIIKQYIWCKILLQNGILLLNCDYLINKQLYT